MTKRDKKSVNTAAARKAAAQKRRRARRFGRIAVLVLEILVLAILGMGFYAISKWDKIDHVDLEEEKEKGEVIVNTDMDESYVEEISKGYTTIGLFGIDGTGTNSDVIMICSINEDTGEIRMASVYRDTWLKMENGTYAKVNHGINGGNYGTSQMNVLNMNLDLNLDHYVLVDWTAVALAIECLGGVEVVVTDAMFQEINSYVTDTVAHLKDGLGGFHLTAPGHQTLSGVQAVAYCRLRHQDSDLGRTQRQREVLEQLFHKAKQADLATLINMINLVFPYITTTMDLNHAIGLATDIGSYHIGSMDGFPYYYYSGKDTNWNMYCTNLINNVSQLHEFLYGTQNYVPSSTVQQISAELDARSGRAPTETTPFDPGQ